MSLESMLNRTATVLNETNEQDNAGARLPTYTEGASFACNIQQARAFETLARGTLGVKISHRLWCRPRADLTEQCRIRSGGADYCITNVEEDVAGVGQLMRVDLLEARFAG